MDANTTASVAFIDAGVVRGVITALTMVVFFLITAWAYHRGNRERFEQDALLVFADDELPADISAKQAKVENGGEEQ